jgi:hypothetical protein
MPFRRPSSASVPSVQQAGSQASSTPQQSQDDVEARDIGSGMNQGQADDSAIGGPPDMISRQPSAEDMDDEELDDLCLNDILEGVSNVQEVSNN